jgi:bifunctional enzyme CysN/CysC
MNPMQRPLRYRPSAAVVWLTGLSGAGKTTIARAVQQRLREAGRTTIVLDGDELREGICADLGFSPADRVENIRRAGQLARLLFDQGAIVLCAFVSPYRESRDRVRALLPPGRFVETFVKADVETCRTRDAKGLYARANAGHLSNLTGVSAPYEEPLSPELIIDTQRLSIAEAADAVLHCLRPLYQAERQGMAADSSGAKDLTVKRVDGILG